MGDVERKVDEGKGRRVRQKRGRKGGRNIYRVRKAEGKKGGEFKGKQV